MNKSINKALIAIAATVFTSTAFAANWVQATPSYEVDIENIIRGSSFTSFWARTDADEPGDSASTLLFFDIKCASKEIRLRTLVKYSLPKGKGNPSNYSTSEGLFEPIIPGSRGHSLYHFVCTSRK